MDATLAVRVEPLLVPGFAAVATLWAGFSGWVVADRVRFDRSQRRRAAIERALGDPSLAALQPLMRTVAVRDMLDRLWGSTARSREALPSKSRSRVSVLSNEYPGPAARSRSFPSSMSARTPTILASSWVRCPYADDLGCGFQGPLSVGKRSMTRRVAGSS